MKPTAECSGVEQPAWPAGRGAMPRAAASAAGLLGSPAGGACALAGGLLMLLGLWLHHSPLNRSGFALLNQLWLVPPVWPSVLSVAGLGVSVLVLVAAWPRRPEGLLTGLLLAFVLGSVLVHGLKYGLNLPRPLAVLPAEAVRLIGLKVTARAMPSGHAATLFALLALLASHPQGRRWATAAVAVLALLVAWARVAAGAHWPADVLVGMGLGLWIGLAAQALLHRSSGRWLKTLRQPGPQRALRLFLFACALYLCLVPTEFPAAEPLPLLLAALAAWTAWRPPELKP